MDLSQLLQAHLASQFLGLGLITLPSSMLQVAVQAYRDDAQKVTVSKSQRQVGESLRRLGISHELEYTTADGLFSIDLAVVDRRIAIEVDGPSHFTVNTLEPLGHTRLRDRLLSAMGWHVVSIPFFEWDKLFKQPEQMDSYVVIIVEQCDNESFFNDVGQAPDSMLLHFQLRQNQSASADFKENLV